jgi:hypothetical protein
VVAKLVTLNRFRYLFAAYIVYATIRTLLAATPIVAAHPGHTVMTQRHLVVLCGLEFLFAFGILIERIRRNSSIALILVFIVAGAISVFFGENPMHLVLYAAITALLDQPDAMAAAEIG